MPKRKFPPQKRHHPDPYRLDRDGDGSVRIRMRFTKEEADRIEEEAEIDQVPVVPWMHMVINEAIDMPTKEAKDGPQALPGA